MNQFQGKTVIVTGGNSGIGKAAALQFAAEGANVAILARNAETGHQAVKEIETAGGTASFHACDVSDEAQVRSAHAEVVATYGRYHAAFNNSGISGDATPTQDITTEAFDLLMKTNAYSVLWCLREQLQHFIAHQTPGAVVNCASLAGVLGRPMMPGYVASKHAAVGLTKAAALDSAAFGIRVNAICPGVTETPTLMSFIDMVPEEAKAQILASIPRGAMATSEELASLAVYLCSDLAANITGQAINSDGGFSVI